MKIVYCDKQFNDPEKKSRVDQAMQKWRSGEHHGLNFEKLRHHQLWSLRVSLTDRVLLTKQFIQGEVCWILLSYIEHHRYDASPFMQPQVLKTFLENHQSAIENSVCDKDFIATEAEDLSEETESLEYTKVQYYQGEFFAWSDAQRSVLKKTFPMVLSGPPGSGKTAIGLELIADYLHQHQANAGRILYCSQTKELVEEIKKYWQTLKVAGNVEFLCFADLCQQKIEKLSPVQFEHFSKWYDRQSCSFDAKKVYQEFRFICLCESLQAYLLLGARSSLFQDTKNRQQLYTLFQTYFAYCHSHEVVDLSFHSYAFGAQYDFVFVDETQGFSPKQLQALLQIVKQQQICFAIDTNQSADWEISLRPYLLELLSKTAYTPPVHCQLQQIFRNSPAVIQVMQSILALKSEIIGGTSDRFESFIIQANKNAQRGGQVYWLAEPTQALRALTASADCVVIVMDELAKQVAMEQFDTPLIFTAKEFQGLEASDVILWDPFASHLFSDMNKLLNDICDTNIKTHRTKDKTDTSRSTYKLILNTLYIAVSRSAGSVYFVAQETHQNRKIVSRLRGSSGQTLQEQVVPTKLASTSEDWARRADSLEAKGLQAHATAIRKKRIKLCETPATNPSHTDRIDRFIATPSLNQLKGLLTASNSTAMIYSVKGSHNMTICQAIRKNPLKYWATLASVPEAEKTIAIIFSDPKVLDPFMTKPHDFFSAKVFGLFSQSEIGCMMLDKRFHADKFLQTSLLLSDHAETFWSYAVRMAQYEQGRKLIVNAIDLALPALKPSQLFGQRIFHYLCLEEYGIKALTDIFIRRPKFLENMHADVLLKDTKEMHSAFSLILLYPLGISLLESILTANPSILHKITEKHLFEKIACAIDPTLTKKDCVYVTYQNALASTPNNQIHLTPFQLLIVQKNAIVSGLLMKIIKNNPNLLRTVTYSHLVWPNDQTNLLGYFAPIWCLAAVKPGSALLDYLFETHPDIINHVTASQLFSPTQLQGETSSTTLFQEFFLGGDFMGIRVIYRLFYIRPDLLLELPAEILWQIKSGLDKSIMTSAWVMMNFSELGKEFHDLLLKYHPALFQKLTAEIFIASGNDKSFLNNHSIFSSLLYFNRKFLSTLFDMRPDLLFAITPAALFSTIQTPDKNSTYISGGSSILFWSVARGTDEDFSLILRILTANPNLCKSLTAKMLYDEFHVRPRKHLASRYCDLFRFLMMSSSGREILTLIYKHHPELTDEIPDNLLTRLILPSESTQVRTLVCFGLDKLGMDLFILLIEKHPQLILSIPDDIFLEKIDNHSPCTIYEKLNTAEKARQILDLMLAVKPSFKIPVQEEPQEECSIRPQF